MMHISNGSIPMNRRQFLSSIASVGVSAALPAKAEPPGLDSRREPCDASVAGRDQIG